MIPVTADGGGNLEVSQPDLGLCLTPDSLIYLSDSAKKPLLEIKAGDLVLSLNQTTGRLEPHRVNALLDMGVKPVYKLTTQSGKTLKTTLNHPYLTRNGWKKLKDIEVGEEIAVMSALERSKFSYGSFDNRVSNKEAAPSIKQKQRFFGLFKREPFVMEGIGNYTDTSVNFDSQLFAGGSGIEVVGKNYSGSEFIGDIENIFFPWMKLEIPYRLFDFRDSFLFRMDYFKVFPFRNFFDRDIALWVDFKNNAKRSLQEGELFEKIYFVNLAEMNERAGINYDFFHVSGPILYHFEQPYPDIQQVSQGQGQRVGLLCAGRFASLGIDPTPYRPTSSLSRFQPLRQLPVRVSLDEMPPLPLASQSLYSAFESPFLNKLYHKLAAVSNWSNTGEEIAVAGGDDLFTDAFRISGMNNPEPIFLDNRQYIFETGKHFSVSQGFQDMQEGSGSKRVNFEHDNSLMSSQREPIEAGKVIIQSNNDPVLFFAERDNFFVASPFQSYFGSSNNIMSALPQELCSGSEEAMVGKQPHLTYLLERNLFVSENVRGIMQTSLDVVNGNFRVTLFDNILGAKPFFNKLQYHINGDSGSFDAGFAETDFGVDRNSIFQGIVSHYSHLHSKLYHNLAAVSNWFKPAAAYAQTAILSENPLISSLRGTASETKQDRSNLKIDCFVGLRPPRAAPRSGAILWDRITAIEYVGELAVYDIEVQGTHNFVAEGILAHNTIQGSGPKAQGTEAQKTEKSPQIGKLAEVLSVEGTMVKVKDSKGNPHTFALDAVFNPKRLEEAKGYKGGGGDCGCGGRITFR